MLQAFFLYKEINSFVCKYHNFFFLFLFLIIFYLTWQYCIGFAIYQNEYATGIHVFPILNPPPSPYHPSGSFQCTSPKHPVLCIEPGLATLHIRWPKYWSFSFSICPSNEYSGLISFGIDCFDLYCSVDSQEYSPASQFKKIYFSDSAFLMVQFSHPYMTTGKNVTLAMQTFVGNVMSLLFNMLSRFVIAFFFLGASVF